MKSRITINNALGNSYLMDIANKLILPNPNINESVIDNDYYNKREKLLSNIQVEDYDTFISKRIRGRIKPYMIEKQLSNLTQLVFEVTEDCNLNCKYCGYGSFYGDFSDRTNSYMSFGMAKSIIDFLYPYWESGQRTSFQREIDIAFYGGEPLMNMKLIQQIITYIESLNLKLSKISYSMTTNAMLLKKHMDYLVEKNFRLLLSLDGNKRNNDYRITKKGHSSYDVVFNNIKGLKNKYPKYFSEQVSFNAVIHNKNSAEETLNFIYEQFEKNPTLSELNTNGIKDNMRTKFDETFQDVSQSLSSIKNQKALSERLEYSYPRNAILLRFLHQYSGNVFKNYPSLLREEKNVYFLPTGTCFPFFKRLFLTVGGNILPCERIGHQYTLGCVNDNKVHLSFEEIANKYNNYFDKLSRLCSKCYMTEQCTQCIFNIEDLDGGATCRSYQSEKNFEKFISKNLTYLKENPKQYRKLMLDVLVQ